MTWSNCPCIWSNAYLLAQTNDGPDLSGLGTKSTTVLESTCVTYVPSSLMYSTIISPKSPELSHEPAPPSVYKPCLKNSLSSVPLSFLLKNDLSSGYILIKSGIGTFLIFTSSSAI